ncbi:MAG: hypothetical protein ACYC6G_20205 [Desulfobaccales bacterium]
MEEAITQAIRALKGEIQKNSICDVKLCTRDNYICIELVTEKRELWLGFDDGKGYFITSHYGGAADSDVHFPLTPDMLSHLVALPRKTADEHVKIPPISNANGIYITHEDKLKNAQELIEVIGSENPDTDFVKDILDRIPTTERGIDVVASIATIKAHRSAI